MLKANAMARLYTEVGNTLVDIENIFERYGVPMPNMTLFARDPNNDKRTVLLSSEKSNEDIRQALEIVMNSASNRVEVTGDEVFVVQLTEGKK